jgi:two-component system sensor kinase FixL
LWFCCHASFADVECTQHALVVVEIRNGKGEMTQQSPTSQENEPTASASPPAPPPVSNLAAKMAHELNNPLDAVLRFVSLAQRKVKAGQYGDIERYLSDAQFGLQRMAEVLRELMDIGRETNQILTRSNRDVVPLADLVVRATRTTAALAEQKRVTLVLKSMLGETAAPAYDLRVAQVLSNLLKNAVEAAPEGTAVRFTAALRNNDGNHMLALTVEDSGPGIPPELLPALFTAFVTSKPNGAGFGLGLAISRELILSLGGTLTLENRTAPQTGCIASILLPLTPEESTTRGSGGDRGNGEGR